MNEASPVGSSRPADHDRYHPDRFRRHRPARAGQPAAAARRAVVDPLRRPARHSGDRDRRCQSPLPTPYQPGGIIRDVVGWLHDFGLSAESLLYVFLPALLFEAALNVDVRQLSDEVGACPPARCYRRHRLHLCRRARLVADFPGRDPGLRNSRRNHRDHRSGRGRCDLSRYRRAAPPVNPGAGREPVQRRRGNRDLLPCRRNARR